MVLCAGLAACVRDPLPWVCAPAGPGDLVVTELGRGQGPGLGDWLELYNASAAPLDLFAGQVLVGRLDGSAAARFGVRQEASFAAPGQYVVLGGTPGGAGAAELDYSLAEPNRFRLGDAGVIDVTACDVLIDRVVYRGLPRAGGWSLDGSIDPPSAAANDDEAAWCATMTSDGPAAGRPAATPGRGNQRCPR